MTATLNRPINKRHYMTKTKWAAIGFAAPLVVYLVIFYIAPLVQNISMSLHRFTRRTFVTGDAPFVGFDIYHEVLSNGEFWTTLRQTLIFVVLSIIFQYAIGLALAVFFQPEFQTFWCSAWRIPCAMAVASYDFWHYMAMDDGC